MTAKYHKTIICLANSRKISGRCLAGKEIAGAKVGQWIRPVSSRESGEVSEEDRRFEDGQYPKLLDKIIIPFEKPHPQGFQTENHLIDENYYWKKVGTATIDDIRKALDDVKGPLWDNTSGSSGNGHLDRVEEAKAAKLNSSLKIVEVTDLKMSVGPEGLGKRKVRGQFTLDGTGYKLAVTDPTVEAQYFAKEDGEFPYGKALLCISLGEPFKGYAYKLIAAIFKI